MLLSQREIETLRAHNAGFLAQKRLARGMKLNLKEAVALLTSQCLEFIREGDDNDDKLIGKVRRLLGFRQVMLGVPEIIHELSFMADFADGTRPVLIMEPICAPDGDMSLALYGSFLPVPTYDRFGALDDACQPSEFTEPGWIDICKDEDFVELNSSSAAAITLSVHNTCKTSRIRVGSHFHFMEANKYLEFDRSASYGMRLNIPAGTYVELGPGETKRVSLVPIGGQRIIRGGNWICDGPAESESLKSNMRNLRKRGFLHRREVYLAQTATGSVKMPRELYVRFYGPCKGDRVKLGDLGLVVEVEKDLTRPGDECVHGIGQVVREGMGQAANMRCDYTLDAVITNVLIIDSVMGIVKADVGIRDGMIVDIGNAGNPHTMDGITPGLSVGIGTDIISGEGLIMTAGSVALLNIGTGTHLINDCFQYGITSIFVYGGGGAGNVCVSGIGSVEKELTIVCRGSLYDKMFVSLIFKPSQYSCFFLKKVAL